MAKKIKFNKINGNDTIANSITTLNQNFELLEDTLETQISKGVSSLQVEDVEWNTSGANGPTSQIKLSNGTTAEIKPIPSADESQSGVVTTGEQTIAGVKTFKNGIITDTITDKKHHNIVVADGNAVYVGGNGGIKLIYDNNGNLSGVEYGFLKGVDLSQIVSQGNDSVRALEELRNYLEGVRNEFNAKFEEQESDINAVAASIAELNFDDLINQNDGMVENYFGQPSEMQELYNEWIGVFEDHVGDTFTDIVNKRCYKFVKSGDSYEWKLLDESEYSAVVKALLNSLDAKSVADGKCTTFYQDNIPAPCYVGDIWVVKKSFYMNGNNQVDYVEGVTTVPNGTVVYYANNMLFCIKDNDTNVPDITDWAKDLSTWSEIQFQKNVETKFDATDKALSNAQSAINDINDDNIFSVFEKRDFLNNTWYAIAGSYTFNSGVDIEYYSNGRPKTNPTEGFLGTSTSGSFWDAVENCIGDNESIDVYNKILGELISAFKELANFCSLNGLFNDSIESSTFETTRTSSVLPNGSNIGAIAKQELADLLYNYYREEEECRKSAYINAATSTIDDLVNQTDRAIQNWYLQSIPTRQEQLPWRKEGESESDYGANDELHISDTAVDLSSTLSQYVYKFSKYTNENEVGDVDKKILNTSFYWKNIKKSDISTIIDELGIDESLAGIDGSINVFNTTPTNYSYGDIWFFNGFSQDDPNHSHLTNAEKEKFVEGCIYYCSNTALDGIVNDEENHNGIRESLVVSDWADGYAKGKEFITRFANMASDSCLTPIEKNQLVRTFYEISGTNLYGNDNDANDDIIKDIFNDDNSNDGSLRFVINDAVNTLLGTPITNYNDLTSFINGECSETEYDTLVELVENLISKFKDIKTALISCGCLEKDTDTDLTQVTFSGFENSIKYNGAWDSSVHITMLSDVFATYYMEEDNLKTFVQQLKVDDLENRLSAEITSIRDVSVGAANAAKAANEAITAINSDLIFSISEKSSFLNNTWRKIAGSAVFNPNLETIDGNGHPVSNYLGTGSNGSFWILVKDLDLRLSSNSNIVNKFKRLGTICNHFGLFNAQLQNSNFGTGVGDDYNANDLYDALFEYYNEEELMRKNVYAASVNETLDALKNQIDGKISTFYGEGLPPSTQQGLSAYWEDANENHINDEYKDIRSIDNGGGKTYIFVVKTSETTITESDVEIDGINYYWKGIDSSNISNIISQLEEAYNNALAEADGAIQIFGEADLPDEYNYGDIWFFGGIDKIQDSNKGNYDLSSFVAGNIYYCEGVYEGSEKGFTTFNPIHWKVGSNAGDTTQRFAHMTSDDWLSVSEKQQLCDEWYKITGIQFSNGYNENNLIQKIESTQPNTGSYYTLVKKYKDNLPNTDDDTPGGGDTPTPGGDTPDVPTYDEENCLTNTKYFYLSNTEYKGTPTITQNESKTTLSFGDENTYIVGYKIAGGDTVKSEDCKTEITFEKDTPSIESVYILSVYSYIEDNLIYPDLNIKYADDKIIITTIDGNYKTIKGYSTNKTSAEDINGESIECSTEGLEYINLYFESTGAISPFNGTTYFIGGSSIDSKKFKIENNKLTIPDEENMFIVAYTMGGKYIKPDEGCKSITISESDKQIESVYLFNLVKDESITVSTISSSIIDDKITIIIKIEKGEIGGCEITGLEKDKDYSLTIENRMINITLKTSSLTKLNTINITSSTPSFSGSLDIEETKENLDNALKNLFKILLTCKCHIQEDTDLSTVNWNSTPVSTTPTLLVNLFNRYYAEEKNLSVELTDLQINNTLSDPITVEELANGIGGKGFVLTSLVELEYNNEKIGGLDGVTEDGNGGVDNVGMWFGGTVENAKKTLNGTLNGESPVPVIITKNGINSKIGPFKIGNSTTNEHIYVGDNTSGKATVIGKDYISMGASYENSDTKSEASENATIFLDKNGVGSRIGPLKIGSSIYIGDENSGNVTVINNDYISMGATYTNSNTKVKAQENSMIYLDKDGEGSRIGPLKIKKDSNNKILTFGNTTQVYSFKNTNSYTASFGTRTGKIIDGHTFSNNELNKSIQYGTSIVDFDNITIINMDTNPGDETLLPDFDGLDKP